MASTFGSEITANGASGLSGFSNIDAASSDTAGTTTSSVTYGNITFNNTYTAAANANTSYKNAILSAEQTIGNLFTNTITLNLTFDAQAAGNTGFLATNSWPSWVVVSYSTLKSTLTAHAPGDSFLTATDPSGGAGWYLPEAYARMLGLSSTTPSTDDTITLNTSYAWTYGQDAVNTVIHEITEGGMGRVGGLSHQNGVWSTMDLFRYSSANTPYYAYDTTNTYFSANGSNLSSIAYDTSATGGDTADFNALDVFGYGELGETNTISTTDIAVMNALGWTSKSNSNPDDYRNTYSDPSLPLGNVTVGGVATGNINYVGDKDVFAVTLSAGGHYVFNLDGTDTSSVYTLRDPYLRLLDSTGNVLATDDDISSSNWGSQLSYTATTGGTYYLEASSSPSDTSYTTGTYQIRAALSADDYRNTYNDTSLPLGNVAIGGSATGTINYVGDRDVFAVTLTAGSHYSFNLDGTDTSSIYTLRDPYLQLLDSSGNVLASDDDIGSGNWSSEIDYTATTSGTYYLQASSSPTDASYTTGTYQVRASTPATLAIGGAATGEINYAGDKGTFAVTLAAGSHYTFNLDGTDISSLYTLRDPYLRLLDSSGNVLASDDDISSSNWSSQFSYTATTGGTYYLQASSSPSDSSYTTGTYQIRAALSADDYRNTYNDASLPLGSVTVGGVATGNINYIGDKDVFAVTLTAGGHYSFNLDGTDTSSVYTLRDPYLRLLDSSGNVLASDDDISSSDWSSQINYTATTGGTYYLEASSSPGDHSYTTGTYQLRATPTASAPLVASSQVDTSPSVVPVGSGNQSLTANAGAEIFDFSNLGFGSDTIAGFDPTKDVLRFGSSLVDSTSALQADMSSTAAGTLLTLDKTHSVMLSGVSSGSLTAANFQFV